MFLIIKKIIIKITSCLVKNIYMNKLGQRHLYLCYHVTQNLWLYLIWLNVFIIILGIIMYFQLFVNGLYYLISGLLGLIFIMSLWFRDVIREGTFEGMCTKIVQKKFDLYIVISFFFRVFLDLKWFMSNKVNDLRTNSVVRNDPLLVFIILGVVTGVTTLIDYQRSKYLPLVKKKEIDSSSDTITTPESGVMEPGLAIRVLTSDTLGVISDVSKITTRVVFGALVWAYLTGRISSSSTGSSSSANSSANTYSSPTDSPAISPSPFRNIVDNKLSVIASSREVVSSTNELVSQPQSILSPQGLVKPIVIGTLYSLTGSNSNEPATVNVPETNDNVPETNDNVPESITSISDEKSVLDEEVDSVDLEFEGLVESVAQNQAKPSVITDFVLKTPKYFNKSLDEVDPAWHMPEMWRILKWSDFEFLKLIEKVEYYNKLKTNGLYNEFVIAVTNYLEYFAFDKTSSPSNISPTWGGLIERIEKIDEVIKKIAAFLREDRVKKDPFYNAIKEVLKKVKSDED